jgi:hypothetical protein
MIDKTTNKKIENINELLSREITALEGIYRLLTAVAGEYKKEKSE